MAKMIIALSAVFFCLNFTFLQAKVPTVLIGDIPLRACIEKKETNDYALEVLGRCIPFQSVVTSLVEVVPMAKELIDRYPQFKFAFCVTALGSLFVVEETYLSQKSKNFVRSERVSQGHASPPPMTAFHVASMTHESGYYELPRPVPVEAPSLIITQNNQGGIAPGPQGHLRPSAPSSPWRSDLNVHLPYIFIFGLPNI